MLGEDIPLRVALSNAAMRTVAEDHRFPPVSPGELDHLDVEVWLLRNPEPVAARGDERAAAVTVGRHGIKVVRGNQQGLFLPSVAIDHQWDARRFLNQVCIKAGMHPTSWLDDATSLYTFEGEVMRGPLANGDGHAHVPTRVCQAEDLRQFAEFCCSNIGALLAGSTPNYYQTGAPDGNVAGVILTLERSVHDGARDQAHFCQVSLRPGVALQSTLFTLCQTAAQMLASTWMANGAQPAIEIGVTVLHDPMLHGTVGDPDLAGVDPRQRALMVVERNKTGIVYDPASQPAELLEAAARLAKVTHPASAAVFSLDTVSRESVGVSTAPQPSRGATIRQPAVAGRFYASDAAQLSRMVDDMLAGRRGQEVWPAALVPHAGPVYSGRIAGSVLNRLRIPRTVIVIGPKHTALGVEWAVAPHQSWVFPGGRLESDPALAQRLCDAIPGLEMDALAHQREHAIEVELPFLHRLAPQSRIVGIAIGAGDPESCHRFAAGLADVLRAMDEPPLLLISSDMNHYATDAENRRLDALALEALERLDPDDVYETITSNNISMCGVLPAVIVLDTLRQLGRLHRAERVAYATSADVSGDTSRVVGYAGMLFG
jgi:AmmeMemoRadiSam system protein B